MSSLNYELAKQLKDAGFPQTSPREVFCNDCGEIALYARCYKHSKEYIVVPSLSELTEACGEYFMLTNEIGNWEAWKSIKVGACRMGESGADFKAEGSTPEEAVANLWLALNKK